jgi:hypothetical protein
MGVSFAALNPNPVDVLSGIQQDFDGMHTGTNIRVSPGRT